MSWHIFFRNQLNGIRRCAYESFLQKRIISLVLAFYKLGSITQYFLTTVFFNRN